MFYVLIAKSHQHELEELSFFLLIFFYLWLLKFNHKIYIISEELINVTFQAENLVQIFQILYGIIQCFLKFLFIVIKLLYLQY